MSAKNFLILLVATVLGVIAAAAAVITRPGDAAYANLGDPVVPGLIDNLNDVDTVRPRPPPRNCFRGLIWAIPMPWDRRRSACASTTRAGGRWSTW